jgi:hypothetical protein
MVVGIFLVFFAGNASATNTSFLGVKINSSDCSFASSDYVTCTLVIFNTTDPTNFTLLSSMNLKKLSGRTTNEVWSRVKVDDETALEEKLRVLTVSDEGSVGLKPLRFNVSASPPEHNISIEFKRTLQGSIGVNDIDFVLLQLKSTNGSAINSQYTESSYTHSSTSFEPAFNWTILKDIVSKTYFVTKQTVEGTRSAVVDYFFKDLDHGDSSPYWSRYLESSSDVGSISGNWIEDDESDDHNHTLQSRTSDGEVTVNFSLLNFDLRDNKSNLINHFDTSSNETNLTASKTYAGSDQAPKLYNIVNKSVTVYNGTGYFLSMFTSFTSTTTGNINKVKGDAKYDIRTPRYFINSSNESTNCYSNKERYLSSDSDIGNAFVYSICDNLTTGNTYNFSLWLEIPQGDSAKGVYISVNQLDECISGFETTSFDINTPNLPPIPNEIINPEFDGNESGIINITWYEFIDPNFDTVTYNISLLNFDETFNRTINGSTTSLSQLFNSALMDDGVYIMQIEGCDNINACSNTSVNFTIDNTVPLINVTSPENTTYNSPAVLLNVSTSELTNVTFSLNGGSNISLYNVSTAGSLIFNAVGTNEINVSAVDLAGNLNHSSLWFTIEIPSTPDSTQTPLQKGKVIMDFEDPASFLGRIDALNLDFYQSEEEISAPFAAMGLAAVPEHVSQEIAGDVTGKITGLDGGAYEVVAEFTKKHFEKSEKIVVARGDLPVDAISAVAYAKILNAPILLTEHDELPDEVSGAIDELGAREAIIIGGTDAISKEVEKQLPSPMRIWGPTRYETSLEIAKEVSDSTINIVIADGEDPSIWTALVAAIYKAPVVYVKGDEVPPELTEFLDEHKFYRKILIGVSDEAAEKID